MKWVTTATIILFAMNLLFAQEIDCDSDQVRRGLRKGETFISPCDSMVVFTKASYSRFALENSILTKNIKLLESLSTSQDSLITVLRKDGEDMEQYINATQPKIDELNEMLERSIKNTEEAVSIARKNKIIWGGAGVGAGLLLGLFLAN